MPDDLRELDSKIAALLEPKLPKPWSTTPGVISPGGVCKIDFDYEHGIPIWFPRKVSTDPADSHWLKQEMVRRGYIVKTQCYAVDDCRCGLYRHDTGPMEADATTEMEAVARATLKALEASR